MFYLHMEHEKEGDKPGKSICIEEKLFFWGVLWATSLEGMRNSFDNLFFFKYTLKLLFLFLPFLKVFFNYLYDGVIYS